MDHPFEQADLRNLARALFDMGVRAADPAAAVHDTLRATPPAAAPGGRSILVAVGKAACPMIEAALAHIPDAQPRAALAVTNYENHREVAGCEVLAAGHPVPDENGLAAGRRVIELLKGASAADQVLFLISGGGSALLPTPVPGVTLADKIRVNEIMLANGLDIAETNLVRQQLSVLKGGGMRRHAAPATCRTLAVSDVIGDDPRVIASGPTARALGTPAQAAALLKGRGLWPKMPPSVRAILEAPERQTPEPQPGGEQAGDISVICSNRITLDAIAAGAPDWAPQIVTDRLCGDVSAAAGHITQQMRATPPGQKALLIWGGETTVIVRGTGLGGRNQELALRVAMQNTDLPGHWVFLAGGTDGRDGPTTAAGGLIDAQTVARLQAAGGDPGRLLARNDSHAALKLAGDLLVTGATGTNVADVAIFLQI